MDKEEEKGRKLSEKERARRERLRKIGCAKFRQQIEDMGHSVRSFAKAAGLDRSYISNVVNGHKGVTPRLQAHLEIVKQDMGPGASVENALRRRIVGNVQKGKGTGLSLKESVLVIHKFGWHIVLNEPTELSRTYDEEHDAWISK